MENALATYNRYSALLAKGAISKSDYDLAEADYTVAKANYDQATSNVNDTVITTPISGYVIGKLPRWSDDQLWYFRTSGHHLLPIWIICRSNHG